MFMPDSQITLKTKTFRDYSGFKDGKRFNERFNR